MSVIRSIAVALAAASATSGCVAWRADCLPRDFPAAEVSNLKGKRAVIVFGDGMPTTVTGPAADATFHYDHARAFFEQGLVGMLRGRVGSLDVAVGAAPKGYDLYLVPAVQMEGKGQLSKSCTLRATLSVRDGSDRVLASETSSKTESFVVIPAGFGICSRLLLETVVESSRAALTKADAALGQRGGKS
jgi:hypothetical protein